MTPITKTCPGCDAEVTREVDRPDGFAGLIAFWCDPCIEADRERELAAEREQECIKAARRVVRSGLPTDLQGLKWDDLDHGDDRGPAIAAAQRWVRGDLPGLIVSGPVGVDKTRIAGTAAAAMLTDRFVHWTSAPLLFARLGSGFDSADRTGVLELLAGNSPLVLDDIDKSRPTEYGAEQIFLAVDQRMANRVPLLVTTNLNSDGLRQKFPDPFGEAIASRLVGYCEGFRIGGQDRRRHG